MNNDCFSKVIQFIEPAKAMKINYNSVTQSFPKKIVLRNYEQVEQFVRWCETFDTMNLQEVDCRICYLTWRIPQNMVVGWVPFTVKKLSLTIYNYCTIDIPDTVEELYLDDCNYQEIRLPLSLKKLTLGKKFGGNIVYWPREIVELIIEGWVINEYQIPICLDELPDTIHTITLSWGTMVQFNRWPEQLKNLTLETCEDDMISQWLVIEHAPIPLNVNFTHIKIPSTIFYE